MPTLAIVIARTLAPHSAHTFGLMGNGNAYLLDALAHAGVPFTAVRHEAATVAAADTYFRATGTLAIASTTYGAGFTNALTPLAEAAQARIPLLMLVGDAPSTGARPWDVDQESLAVAVGVPTIRVDLADPVAQVHEALTLAHRHRRPVVLALPYDLPQAEVPEPAAFAGAEQLSIIRSPQACVNSDEVPVNEASTPEIAQAVSLLSAAAKPAILAGVGAWRAGAGPVLSALADRLGAITATTALAQGLFERPEYDLGITGGFGQDQAMELLGQADVVLVVGASLNQFTTRFGTLLSPEAHLVRIDLDEVLAVAAGAGTGTLLRGDAAVLVDALLQGLGSGGPADGGWRAQEPSLGTPEIRKRASGGAGNPEGTAPDGLLDPRAVATRLADLLPSNRTVVSDGGHFLGWANMYWPVASPDRMHMVGTAYQTIGLGFPSAVGAAVAHPDHTTVLTTGDGGGLMALADLESFVRVARSGVVVVWNDAAYGAEVHLYGRLGLDQAPMLMPQVSFAALGEAVGAQGVVVRQLSDLDALREWSAAGAIGTIVLDCRISRSIVAPYQEEIVRAAAGK